MQLITAPQSYTKYVGDISVFLAGPVTTCEDWQNQVVMAFQNEDDDLILINPRRDSFDINKKEETRKQIEWEFNMIELCDIFSMYFCGGESVQPISMYELGRNLVRMQQRFPSDWRHRIVITVDPKYEKFNDVVTQVHLATRGTFVFIGMVLEDHISNIQRGYKILKDRWG